MLKKRQKRTKDEIDKIYDSIRTKDMTREEFRSRYVTAMNPKRAQAELMFMVEQLKQRRTTEQKNRQMVERSTH